MLAHSIQLACSEVVREDSSNAAQRISEVRPFNCIVLTTLAPQKLAQISLTIFLPLKRFLHLKMLNSAPKCHKLMPEIPNVRFSCGNSNITDLLQIWPLKFRPTSTTRRDRMSPNYAEKRKKHVPKIG
jgi:hypothetical protein